MFKLSHIVELGQYVFKSLNFLDKKGIQTHNDIPDLIIYFLIKKVVISICKWFLFIGKQCYVQVESICI